MKEQTTSRAKVLLIGAGVVIGLLMLSPVAAHVSNSVDHLWGTHLRSKADARYVLKNQARSARVAADGALIQGRGVTGSGKEGTGVYFVTFNREVQNCAAVATPRANSLIPSTDQYGLNPNALEITFVNTLNNPVDTAFSLFVRC